MKNKENKFKGWLISLLVLLIFFNNLSNVKALETDYLEEINLTEKGEEIINEDVIEEDVLEDNQKEVVVEENVEKEKTKEEIFTAYSKNLEFRNNEVIVKGNINELTTVGELLNNINITELITNYSIEKITVTSEEDVLLASDEYITNKCHLIIISNEYIANYKISFLGDLNKDNLVNDKDIETGIEDFFDEGIKEEEKKEVEDIVLEEILPEVENEEVFSELTKEETIMKEDITITEEISYIDAVIKNNSYEVEIPTNEEISINLENITSDEFYVSSNIAVELSLDGFINNYINTISGNIEYNNEVLLLENIYITVDDKVIGKYIDNKFIYVLDNYYDTKPLLLIIFKSIKEGTTDISISNLRVAMNGTLLNVNNNTNLNISILEPGKGGDVEIETPSTIIIPSVSPSGAQVTPNTINTNIISTNKVNLTTNNEFVQQLSNDNYIKNIEIIDYEINFDKDINYYSIDVDNNTNSLNLNITLNNEFTTYEIIGNDNFMIGNNEVIIVVTSQNNETRNYIIEVNKKEEKEDTNINEETGLKDSLKQEFDDKQIFHILSLIILIIIIIILIYKLLRSDN